MLSLTRVEPPQALKASFLLFSTRPRLKYVDTSARECAKNI